MLPLPFIAALRRVVRAGNTEPLQLGIKRLYSTRSNSQHSRNRDSPICPRHLHHLGETASLSIKPQKTASLKSRSSRRDIWRVGWDGTISTMTPTFAHRGNLSYFRGDERVRHDQNKASLSVLRIICIRSEFSLSALLPDSIPVDARCPGLWLDTTPISVSVLWRRSLWNRTTQILKDRSEGRPPN